MDAEGRRTGLLQSVPGFDGRSRPWFRGALEKGGDTWTEIYVLFTGQDLVITASYPVYDGNRNLLGVLVVDLFLSHLETFLHGLEIGRTGVSFVMEHSGLLVASSVDEPVYTPAEGKEPARRLDAKQSASPMIRAAAQALEKRYGDFQNLDTEVRQDFLLDGRRQYLQTEPVHDAAGLDWTIVTVLPESDYMTPVDAGAVVTSALIILTLLLAAALGVAIARWVIRPIARLDEATRSLARGESSRMGIGHHWIAEIEGVSLSFDAMAEKLERTVRDLTQEVVDRTRAEQELERVQKRLEFILGATRTGLDIIDADFNMRYVDPEWQKIYGDPAGRKCYEYFQGGTDVCPGCSLEESFRSKSVTVSEQTLAREGDRPILVTSIPFRDDNGDWMVAEVNVDILERKRMETERLERERRLLHGQKLESLGVLAGGIAHDFNNLLMVIGGNLDLALPETASDSRAHGHVREALQASRAASDLTRLMLAYSGKGRIVFEDLDLAALVSQNTHMFQSSVAKTVTLELRLASGLPAVEADRGQIQQVIMNLFTNSSEAIGVAPGTILMSVGETECDAACLEGSRLEEKPAPGRFVCLEVTDTGCGMDETTLRRLFDPFYSTKATGRGLGMSAVQGIVKGHKGAILVQSVEGKGTTIRVLFPASARGVLPEEKATDPSVAGQDSAPQGAILVADDEEAVRMLCAAYAKRLGFPVFLAADGEEAVRVFAEHADEITCVLLDLTMPRMDGFTALRRILDLRPEARVILCSGYGEETATERFRNQGLSGFLQKPFRLQELRDAISRALRKG